MIYLDNNATTRLDPEVLDAMMPLLTEHWGNPGSSHSGGRPVAKSVHVARRAVAERFGLQPNEIVFVASATEADNLALRGVLLAAPAPRHLVTERHLECEDRAGGGRLEDRRHTGGRTSDSTS